MASTSGKTDQDAIPSTFTYGDFVLVKFKGSNTTNLSVICPNFGSSEALKYTEVKNIDGKGLTRFYHVQAYTAVVQRAWFPKSELKRFDEEFVESLTRDFPDDEKQSNLNWCKKVCAVKNGERVEICRIRAETFDSFKKSTRMFDKVIEKEICKMKLNGLYQWQRLKESCDKFEKFMTSQNQDKQNEQKIASEKDNQDSENAVKSSETKIQEENEQLRNDVKELKASFEDLKNCVMSKNHDQAQNEQGTESNNQNANESDFENPYEFEHPAKKIKLEKVEDNAEEIQKLNETIKDLKKDVLEISKENGRLSRQYEEENAKLSKRNEEYEKMQNQNETLKNDNLNLSQENARLSREIEELQKQIGEPQKQNDTVIKKLKEDLMKLSKENFDLKYGSI